METQIRKTLQDKADRFLKVTFGDNDLPKYWREAVIRAMKDFYIQESSLKDERIDKLQKFKDYVHGRLDAMGVPSDPEPENNASHGCRIEGRLNYVSQRIKELEEGLRNLVNSNPNEGNWNYTAAWHNARKLITPVKEKEIKD